MTVKARISEKDKRGRDGKPDTDKIKKRVRCVFFLSINSAYCKQT